MTSRQDPALRPIVEQYEKMGRYDKRVWLHRLRSHGRASINNCCRIDVARGVCSLLVQTVASFQ